MPHICFVLSCNAAATGNTQLQSLQKGGTHASTLPHLPTKHCQLKLQPTVEHLHGATPVSHPCTHTLSVYNPPMRTHTLSAFNLSHASPGLMLHVDYIKNPLAAPATQQHPAAAIATCPAPASVHSVPPRPIIFNPLAPGLTLHVE